ncbi:hypothetical protein HDA32_002949 [Spinactinospora alkalitolerans]|uniref:Peptide synthetase n=1 Tax=Spinactinospora alkalitolerans TaxID=687207 RepID=A0A852TUW9_9ACTN|nr:amino acid synthesis family protein [Spinactinospora alkalitolerans]NYE47829.1 hypothetical protein [Spinactinospora alkalitolerans]
MPRIRKIVTLTDELLSEPGGPSITPTRRVAAAAVLTNPWAGLPVGADLGTDSAEAAARLAVCLTERLLAPLGGPTGLQAFGKGAVVGVDGEIEHGAALIHTPYFGNLFRELVQGTSIIAFADERSAPGAPLTVPMWHKTEAATRSHYQTVQVKIADAPRPDELIIIAAGAAGPRPHPRIGDRTTDARIGLKDMEHAL